VHLTRPDLEIEIINRMHAAEAQRHLFQRQGASIGRRAEQACEQVGPRDDRPVALERGGDS
jgi:hypothetical protein